MADQLTRLQESFYNPQTARYINSGFNRGGEPDKFGLAKPTYQRESLSDLTYSNYQPKSVGSGTVFLNTRLNDGLPGMKINMSLPDMRSAALEYEREAAKAKKTGNNKDVIRVVLDRFGIPYEDKYVDYAYDAFNFADAWNTGGNFSKGVGTAKFMFDTAKMLGYNPSTTQQNIANSAQLGLAANRLFDNWGNMNTTERMLASASFLNSAQRQGQALYRGVSTDSIARTNVDLGLSGAGTLYEGYNLVQNWDKMSNAQRALATARLVQSGYTTAQIASMVGKSATAGTAATTGAAASAGGSAVGATGSGATAAGGGFGAGQALSAAASLYGAYELANIVKAGQGGARGRSSGAMAGATAGSYFGPWGAVIGAAAGAALGSINSGKSAEQEKRDALRGAYKEAGLFKEVKDLRKEDPTVVQRVGGGQFGDTNHIIQLADGTYFNVGSDGSKSRAVDYKGNVRAIYDPSKITEADKKNFLYNKETGAYELRPYDIDYTSDLSKAAEFGTFGLNALLQGGTVNKNKNSEALQMNGYLTNAALSNIGSMDMNPENFKKAMANVRSAYAQIGLKEPSEIVNYFDQLKAQGKITRDDYNKAILGLDMAFNESYDTYEKHNSIGVDTDKLDDKLAGREVKTNVKGYSEYTQIEGEGKDAKRTTLKPGDTDKLNGKKISHIVDGEGGQATVHYEDGDSRSVTGSGKTLIENEGQIALDEIKKRLEAGQSITEDELGRKFTKEEKDFIQNWWKENPNGANKPQQLTLPSKDQYKGPDPKIDYSNPTGGRPNPKIAIKNPDGSTANPGDPAYEKWYIEVFLKGNPSADSKEATEKDYEKAGEIKK